MFWGILMSALTDVSFYSCLSWISLKRLPLWCELLQNMSRHSLWGLLSLLNIVFFLFSLYWHIEPPSTLQLSSLGCNQHSKHIRKCLAATSRVIFRRFTPEIYTQLFYISSWYVSLFWHLAWTIKKNALINMQSGLLELFLQPRCHVNPSLLRWTVSWKASLVFPEESKEI